MSLGPVQPVQVGWQRTCLALSLLRRYALGTKSGAKRAKELSIMCLMWFSFPVTSREPSTAIVMLVRLNWLMK